MKNNIFLIMKLSLFLYLTSCTLKGNIASIGSKVTILSVETKADGTGEKISDFQISVGSTKNLYLLKRDKKGNLKQAIDISWDISNKTIGTLAVSSSKRQAIFTAVKVGAAKLKITNNDLAVFINVNVIDETLPTVEFVAAASSMLENAGAGIINVSLSQVSTKTVSVTYSVTGGSAGFATDYTLPAGTLVFAPGEVSKTISFSILDDVIFEGAETFIVELSSPVNTNLSLQFQHTMTILDDDTLTAIVTGVPTGTNNTTNLDITVSGAGLTHYQYKLVEFPYTLDCDSALNYSVDVPVGTHILDNIASLADGGVRLCVIGKNAAGLYQSLTTPTIATWTKEISAVEIYRSVGFGKTTSLATGGSNAMTIVGGVATFAAAVPNNVGVGDVIQYDSNTKLVFIHGRTDSTHYTVRTAAGAVPPDKTSDTTWAMYRAYTGINKILNHASTADENDSLADAIENFDTWSVGRDLVANNEKWYIALYADAAETGQAIIHNWNTDENRDLTIFVPSLPSEVGAPQRHNGYWSSDRFRINGGRSIQIENIKNLTIDGLQIYGANNAIDLGYYANSFPAADANIVIKNNILQGITSTSYSNSAISYDGSLASTINANIYIINNVIYNRGLVGTAINPANCGGCNTYIYNNTTANNYRGIGAGGASAVLKNNISVNNSYANYLVTFLAGSTHNLSSTDNIDGAHSYSNRVVHFRNPNAGDFRLEPFDTAAKDLGADLSSDPHYAFSEDSFNQTRNGLWDLGAGEILETPLFRSVGTSTVLAIGSSNDLTILNGLATLEDEPGFTVHFGVGDAIQYDSDNNGSVDSVIFIHGVIDRQNLIVRTPSGAVPSNLSVPDNNWRMYRAYTSLSNAESGIENTALSDAIENFDTWSGGKDIVAANQQWNIALYGEQASDGVVFSGWTTNRTAQNSHIMRLFAPTLSTEVDSTQKHQGVWDAYKARIESSANACILNIQIKSMIVDGIQIKSTLTNANTVVGICNGTQVEALNLKNNLITAVSTTGGANYGMAISETTEPSEVFIDRNLIYKFNAQPTDQCIRLSGNNPYYSVMSNTVVKCGVGFYADDATTSNQTDLINNLCQTHTSACFSGFSGGVGSAEYNAASDATGPGGGDIDNAVAIFLNPQENDFRLSGLDAVVRDAGDKQETYHGLYFSQSLYDNRGYLVDTIDIGAHEAAAAIYRSVGVGSTAAVTTGGGSNSFSITNGVATFDSALVNNVGVGDALVYALSTKVVFISSRNSSTGFLVRNYDGSLPEDMSNDSTWSIYRAYHRIDYAETGSENTGIPAAVRSFDSWSNGRDLVRNNEQWNIVLYADAVETNPLNVDGWTSNQNNFLRIFVPYLPSDVGVSQRHAGAFDAAKYRIEPTIWSSSVDIHDNIPYTRIEGLQVKLTSESNADYVYGISVRALSGKGSHVAHNIVWSENSSAIHTVGIYGHVGQILPMYIYNNIVFGFTQNSAVGIAMFDSQSFSGAQFRVYNNTAVGNYEGIGGSYSGTYLKNNIAVENTNLDFWAYDMGAWDNNLSSDASAYGTGALINRTVTFVDALNKDYRLSNSDVSGAIGGGLDLSLDSILFFSTDITGANRSAPWSIGASQPY